MSFSILHTVKYLCGSSHESVRDEKVKELKNMSHFRYLEVAKLSWYLKEGGLMLIENLIKTTVELQGFRVMRVTVGVSGLMPSVFWYCSFVGLCGIVDDLVDHINI